jgi:hypothetical protein
MKRKRPAEVISPFGEAERKALAPLKSRLVRWAKDHVKALRQAMPTLPEGLDDRAGDIWYGFLAIADAIGGLWPSCARSGALVLSGPEQREQVDVATYLLRALREIFRSEERLKTATILHRLNADENAPWLSWKGKDGETGLDAYRLGKLLRPYGMRPTSIRLPGEEKTAKGYYKADLLDTWERYLVPDVPDEPLGIHRVPYVSDGPVSVEGDPVGDAHVQPSGPTEPEHAEHVPAGASMPELDRLPQDARQLWSGPLGGE